MSNILIQFQSPVGNKLRSYNRSLPASQQPCFIPATFCNSIAVRELVFVEEMKAVPLVHHIDTDDARSCHWVLYSSPQNSSNETPKTKPQPIGTIRLVPFPHYPHPQPGARYDPPAGDVPVDDSYTFFSKSPPAYAIDRATSLHDGREPFLKLARLCVVKEFRGKRLADQLVQMALKWAGENPISIDGIPKWNGLVCIHAQEKAVSMWQRNGFVVDEGMGTWFEAGIRHYGMFTRAKIKNQEE